MKARGTFKILKFRNPQKTVAYRVSGTKLGGERVRENFKSEPEALARKQELEIEGMNIMPEKRITATRLTSAQEAEAERCLAELAELGGQYSMTFAIRWFKENYREPLKKITVASAFDQFLAAKEKDGLRDASLKALKSRVGFLVKRFSERLVSDILPADVKEVIAKPGITNRSKEDNRRSLSSFFSWSMDQEYCLSNPAKKTTRARQSTEDDVEPAILSLSEARRLIEAAQTHKDGKLVPYVALGLFAGIRPTELARITWSNIDLEAATVTIGAKMAKMRQRRIVEFACVSEKDKEGKELTLPANLLAWLLPHAAKKTPIKGVNWRKDFDAIKAAAGWGMPTKKQPDLKPWTQDIMRHTAISNHLAYYQHEGKTAAWAGNSPDVIQRHYKGLVKQTVAADFWKILPSDAEAKIINMPAEAAG